MSDEAPSGPQPDPTIAPMPVAITAPVTVTASPDGNGTDGLLISKQHRDVVFALALILALGGVLALGVGAFFRYPAYEVGVTASFYTLSNIASYLLGMKSASTVPPVVAKSSASPPNG